MIFDLYTFNGVIDAINSGLQKQTKGGRWVPARPLPYYSFKNRLKLAWMVLTYKADALIWPEDEGGITSGPALKPLQSRRTKP